jgi:hypothetical protein
LAIEDAKPSLISILDDKVYDERLRQKALILYCYVAQREAQHVLERYATDSSLVGHSARISLEHLRLGGEFSL